MSQKSAFISFLLVGLVSLLSAQISPRPADFNCDAEAYSESFESGIPAGWQFLNEEMAKNSGFNEGWVRDMGMTFTANTGPTTAYDGDYYVYCDGSGPIARGDTAYLISPTINTGLFNGPALIFRLNMFGQSGVLFVRVIHNSIKTQVLGPISGAVPGGIHTADEWEEIFVDLSDYKNSDIQLEFAAMKPSDASTGDIAIDNIQICGSSNTIPTLSQWGVICSFLLLLIFAVTSLKQPVNQLSVT